MKLNDNIRQFRKDKGYTQEFVSENLNMTQSNYCRVEKGLIDDVMLGRIAKAMNTTPDALRYYHLPPIATATEQTQALLQQKDELLALLKEQIQYLREENKLLHARLADCLQGGESLSEQPLKR